MPDILIRGIEMPTDCYTCRFRTTVGLDEWMCMVNKMRFPSWETGWNGDTYRHENCPLVELPPHGDLIDRDAFDADARKRYCSACDNYNGTKCRACWVDDMLGDVADFEEVIPWNKEETP